MRVALLSHNACRGDALGNHLAVKARFFLDRAADVRVFIETDQRLHPQVAPLARLFDGSDRDADVWGFLTACDLICVEYAQYYPLLDLLPLLAETGSRVVVDYHGVTPPRWGVGHHREAVELGVSRLGLAGCADAALTHSTFTRAEFLRRTQLPEERCFPLGYSVNGGRFRPRPPGGSPPRRFGPSGATTLLFVGRLAANKRVPVLVEALARLRDRRPEIHALIAGDTGDLYGEERQRCSSLAEELGVADRLHFLGWLGDEELPDLYRSADLFVMPSRHEGFCLPVVEAMASGVPVIAARSTALPETVGDAGLSFEPDDADDLAGQIGRVLDGRKGSPPVASMNRRRRVAVVAFRYGEGFAGGAEASLRTVARALHTAGHHVSLWTTCNLSESDWANHLPEGTTDIDGIPVRRFRIDPHDRARHVTSLEAINSREASDEPISAGQERDYIEHSVRSAALLDALREFDRTQGPLDAVVVGPYLFGLTYDVAREFGGRTLLLPCFHDEPLARLRLWRETYTQAGGILYHSPEEQHWAEAKLGINHPGARQLGTYLDTQTSGDAEAGRRASGTSAYVVYCGRYSAQKEVPALVEFARRYREEYPSRFTFVFLGQGEVTIPCRPGFRDLGFVSEKEKRDVLAGAAALVQLSRRESLSLTVLEAWAQGVPVLVNRGCPVLVGQLQRSQGGEAVEDYESFAAALNDLWQRPEYWRELGRRGREFVRRQYGEPSRFLGVLEGAVADLSVPLAERMRRRGLKRAARFDRRAWREQFAQAVEAILETDKRPRREEVEVTPRAEARSARVGGGPIAVPLRVHNRGTHPLACSGPARTVLRCRVHSPTGAVHAENDSVVSVPRVVLPGESVPASLAVPVPQEPGDYRVLFWAERADRPRVGQDTPASGGMELTVADGSGETSPGDGFLDAVRSELAELERVRELPDDYLDVTEGLLAGWKRLAKRKLLNNFKKAYVDVLSRQQSACNRHLLRAAEELVEYCATLEHALIGLGERVARLEKREANGDSAGGGQEFSVPTDGGRGG